MEKLTGISDFHTWQEGLKTAVNPDELIITVCDGTGCIALGSAQVCAAFEQQISEKKLDKRVRLKRTGCHGFCEKGPVVVIQPEKIFYAGIKAEDVEEILDKTILGGELIDRLLYVDPTSGKKSSYEYEVPFYARQQRNVFRYNGKIDPVSLEDYVTAGGYAAFAKALEEYSGQELIEIIIRSGLRGRGGGGFPTGLKWDFCRKSAGDEKYLICNADEGDPGAFMDRSILEGTPHAVIEGMLIAGLAIGACRGFIYVRAEYPLAVKNTIAAIEQARAAGLLGGNILGTDFSIEVEIRQGAGAFVCGEETALIASLEGRRGMPIPKPPFPAQKGYHGKPTNINNVETFVNVPLIINNGAEWYSSIGTEGGRGTKIFALAGKVNNTGLVEVPMGSTLRQIVFDIGGGIPDDGKFKAAQMGGPSGGCVPEQFLDLGIDFDSVKEIGAIMGSGGLIVMDEGTCMVDVARYFLEFVQSESCGKCTPCRVGTKEMLQILDAVCEGRAASEHIDRLERLAEHVGKASLCGLGQTAPNPVLTTLRYFRNEYEDHIEKNQCPAFVCTPMIGFHIDPERCTGCGSCARACPAEAIAGEKKKTHVVNQELCIRCGACLSACPKRFAAVYRRSGELTKYEKQKKPKSKN